MRQEAAGSVLRDVQTEAVPERGRNLSPSCKESCEYRKRGTYSTKIANIKPETAERALELRGVPLKWRAGQCLQGESSTNIGRNAKIDSKEAQFTILIAKETLQRIRTIGITISKRPAKRLPRVLQTAHSNSFSKVTARIGW